MREPLRMIQAASRPEWMEKGIPYADRGKEKERFKAAV